MTRLFRDDGDGKFFESCTTEAIDGFNFQDHLANGQVDLGYKVARGIGLDLSILVNNDRGIDGSISFDFYGRNENGSAKRPIDLQFWWSEDDSELKN